MTILDAIPLWAFFFIIVILSLLFIECGYRFSKFRFKSGKPDTQGPAGSVVSSTLGLLAFMLAFTFGLATERFDARRALVVEEANAIGTTYLRSDFIEEPYRTNVKNILREYTALRVTCVVPPEMSQQLVIRSESLQDRLWAQTAAVGQKHPNSPICALFIDTVNNVIDVHTKRITAGFRTRVPGSIWLALFAIAALSMAGMGYYCSLTGKRCWSETIILSAVFSTAMLLVVDLDRPWEGSIQVSQQPMIDLAKKIGPPSTSSSTKELKK